MSPALGSRLSNDSIRKREATMKANARASRLALAERVREALMAEAHARGARFPHWCMSHSEIAEWLGGVDLSKLVEGE